LPIWIEADRRTLTGRADRPMAMGPSRGGAPPALPVYDEAIRRVQERLGDLPPWLALAGNYLGRLGVSRLLDVSREAADRVTAFARAATAGPPQPSSVPTRATTN
jgi:hypothetical protein